MGEPAAAKGEVIDDRLQVLSGLGTGAMGAVDRARDLSTGRDVAVKLVLDSDRRPQRRDRFLREGQVAASLEHPGIVGVHSLGEWREGRYGNLALDAAKKRILIVRRDRGAVELWPLAALTSPR